MHNRLLGCVVLTGVVMLVSACGRGPALDDAAEVSAGPTPSSSEELPSAPEGMPAIRDITNLRIPLDQGEEFAPGPSRAYEDYDVDRKPPWHSFSVFQGYTGPLFSQLQWDRGVTVLRPTLGVGKSDNWTATVLARNDSLERVGTVSVTAHLFDDAGRQLEVVNGESPVPEARAGEPVPVRLEASVLSTDVARVTLEGLAAPAPPTTTRELGVQFMPAVPPGDREPVHSDIYTEPAGTSPYPLVQWLRVTATGDVRGVSEVHSVVAWMDEEGRIAHLTEVTGEAPLANLAGGVDGVATVEDQRLARELVSFQPLWWGVGVLR